MKSFSHALMEARAAFMAKTVEERLTAFLEISEMWQNVAATEFSSIKKLNEFLDKLYDEGLSKAADLKMALKEAHEMGFELEDLRKKAEAALRLMQ